jgi:hypothetical protein
MRRLLPEQLVTIRFIQPLLHHGESYRLCKRTISLSIKRVWLTTSLFKSTSKLAPFWISSQSPFNGSYSFGQHSFSSGSLVPYVRINDVKEDVKQLKRQLDPYDLFMLELLMEYHSKHGDCHVPTGRSAYVKEERQKMEVSEDFATWVVKQRSLHQRHHHKNNISSSLATKFFILQSMGFMWSCREAQWQRNFNRLEQHGQQNEGNLRVSQKDDPRLFEWLCLQRKAFQKGKLAPERESLLREIGFVFDPQEASWWNNYELLCQYKDKHGDTLVPTTNTTVGTTSSLGRWVARQRHFYQIDQLEEHRIKALNEIGFVWDVPSTAWDVQFAQLQDFFKLHGHTRVPRSAGALWNWTDRQRRSLKQLSADTRDKKSDDDISDLEISLDERNSKKLMEIGINIENDNDSSDNINRAKRLMNLTFEVALHDESWMTSFRELCTFKDKCGHFSVPGKYRGLSNWVRNQRYYYHHNALPENRVALLNSVGFPWTAELARWNRMYEELLCFHRENGHARVPCKDASLYRWTVQQRRNLQSKQKSFPKSWTDEMTEQLMVLRKILIN